MKRGTYRFVTGFSLALLVGVLLGLESFVPSEQSGLVVWSTALVLSVLGAAEVPRMTTYRAFGWRFALPVAAFLVGVVSWVFRAELFPPDRPWLGVLAGAGLAAAVGFVLGRRARALAAGFAIWTGVPLYGLLGVYALGGVEALGVLVLLSKIGDIFGYFVGKAIGKRHPFPVLSPNKTLAGCVASLVAGVGAGGLLGALGVLPEGAGLLAGLVTGLLVNVAAQAADLFESKVKRAGGVKDSGTLCAAAGGVLDVVDSLLFTVPLVLLLWPLLPAS